MLWLTAIRGVGLPAIGMESHAPMVHRLPTSRGNMLELIALATLLISRSCAGRVKHNGPTGFRKRSSPPTMHLSRRASASCRSRADRRRTDFGRGGEVITSVCNPTIGTPSWNWAHSRPSIPSDLRSLNVWGRIAVTVPAQVLDATIELGLQGQRHATVSASNSRSRPLAREPGRRSDQVSSVSSWATTRRNPASNSVISNKSRWF